MVQAPYLACIYLYYCYTLAFTQHTRRRRLISFFTRSSGRRAHTGLHENTRNRQYGKTLRTNERVHDSGTGPKGSDVGMNGMSTSSFSWCPTRRGCRAGGWCGGGKRDRNTLARARHHADRDQYTTLYARTAERSTAV